jgi:signal transduction histidine kinase
MSIESYMQLLPDRAIWRMSPNKYNLLHLLPHELRTKLNGFRAQANVYERLKTLTQHLDRERRRTLELGAQIMDLRERNRDLELEVQTLKDELQTSMTNVRTFRDMGFCKF